MALFSKLTFHKSVFIKEGCDPIRFLPGEEPIDLFPPLPIDDSKLITIDVDNSHGSYETGEKFSSKYKITDVSDWIHEKLLKGIGGVHFTQLVFPFQVSSYIKYIYVEISQDSGPPRDLYITFTHSNFSITRFRFTIPEPRFGFEWHSLPVELSNVVKCEIECPRGHCWKSMPDTLPRIYGIRFIHSTEQ
ncbi:hypothetical protein ADUPG1_012372 [Aduncisulcus paluster]|uniref:Uncharacterized protein n=1 Tax=Aduncisulcus paluster TaxID=2918883 RepID=A0ABQ5JZ75_9EUKA|nr:hypothetical protein ADUPG1_012372 [Aduncisulcus paluster]